MSFGTAFGAFAESFAGARQAKTDRAERKANVDLQNRYLDIMEKNPGMMSMGSAPSSMPVPGAGGGAVSAAGGTGGTATGGGVRFNPDGSISRGASGGGSFAELLRRTEGAGDYDTLFGHSQRGGGRFAGVRPSQMTLDQLYSFTDPKGEYGQFVASRNNGVVGTPLGAGQIVGSTLRRTAQQLGLPGDTVFSPEVQNRMIDHLAANRLRSAKTPEARRAALRAEWHGFKSVSDAELDAAISHYQQRGTAMGARPPAY